MPPAVIPVAKTAPVLEVRDLTAHFRVGRGQRLRALHRVSFALQRGKILALVGESGSGKSTVSKVVARLVAPTAGQVRLDGVDVLRQEPRGASLGYRGRVQMIFQDPFGSLNPAHDVAHHLERPLLRHHKATRGSSVARRVLALLGEVGLDPPELYASKRPGELSGGQRQRVAIARALAVEPDVVLADEPTSMLDVSIRMEILNLMQELVRGRGVAILLVTHDIASARYLADEIAVMYAGEIVEMGPADDVALRPRHPYTELLLSAVPDRLRPASPILRAAGERPDLVHPGPGCPFAARCPHVMPRCREAEVPRHTASPTHFVRCHLAELDTATKEPVAS